ncbi:hypothetical protein JCM19037_793 [Geomicrobium sp. JCM 19037]|uniref:S-layer homology domain-containing protein n=1 Tax=unclassified Geomicrobium TaxID=2628951 RepID=UPI00045F1ACC|nr:MULTISPECIES: S-layer homology domain-containing protein [unclassified Geomicrobium]GAK02551.1 hypothetical protein JCM19037_793 [Geomicrobium sp. JCM 19037]GAK11597.1 hypothetical protein JCM19039_1304 [Geomicrobium sp. JCM 19039]
MNENTSGYEEVNQLADSGITTQVNTDFRPNHPTNRAQFSVFIARTINEEFRN